jgi:hypothetical protein
VSKEKDMIYQSLNIDKPKKIKLGKKKIKKGKVSLDKFLNENFSMLSIK